ncbi:hypothetical protein Vadar_024286 [Vaccinium darrowii]|uniref:Uncharacterized protein n=1 Tax=Vaccinium darrowii TaxID=229202 RepID=A0ACB7Y2M8_9ERIC|nr:hypothetical protein Vadar_024286 [Vaccinium darrowii]
MEQEVSSDSSVEIRDATENDLEDSEHVMEQIEDPKVGMRFTSVDEIHKYYAAYAKQKGFSIVKKSFKKGGDGEMKYLTFAYYDISKKLEHAYRSLQVDPTSISAVDPKLYSRRFRDFIGRIFIEDQ